MRHALAWIAAFLHGQEGALIRRIAVSSKEAAQAIQIICDASPWGLGALLTAGDEEILSWFGAPLQDSDLQALGVATGDCRGQAALEALCLLVALRTWAPRWRHEAVVIMARSDAMAALGALNRTSSSNPVMNQVVREAALDMAEGAYELDILGHLPATWNVVTDALSRLFAPAPGTAEVPSCLPAELRVWPEPRSQEWWRTLAAPRGGGAGGAPAPA